MPWWLPFDGIAAHLAGAQLEGSLLSEQQLAELRLESP
jgi:hypothetical protein